MYSNGKFVAILKGKSGKYYTAHQWQADNIPTEEEVYLTDLVYDSVTKVIYYEKCNGKRLACRKPYTSENGKCCRLADGEIVEIG